MWRSIRVRELILRRTDMKKLYLFVGLLLGAMLPTVALCTPNVTGKWSGTLQMDGENEAKPAYSILIKTETNCQGASDPTSASKTHFKAGMWKVTN
jgi:hypothetical protein